MDIIPNSVIKFYHNVPLNNKYNNTLWFDSLTAQNNYFHNTASILTATFNNQTYQRVNKGTMRVGIKADSLYNCNYLAFQNTNYGNKWFYAFINSVEYVNNEVCEVSYEIDVMQTYAFDYILRECYVEREHILNDVIGANTESENVEMGDIKCSLMLDTMDFGINLKQMCAVICTAHKPSDSSVRGLVGGMFSGLYYLGADINSVEGRNALLNYIDELTLENKVDSIVSIFLMPNSFYTSNEYCPSYTINVNKANTNIDGYIPRNKKLFSYPFNYLLVRGSDDREYRYEWFNNSENYVTFELRGVLACNPEFKLVPRYYNGYLDSSKNNPLESVYLRGYPQIAIAIDSFRAWLAQSATNDIFGMLGSALSLNPLGVVQGAVNTFQHAFMQPDIAKGGGSTNIDVAIYQKDIYFLYMQIKSEYAKIIDDYFDMYGYATNRVKIPNRSTRPHWNYVKTRNCCINGSMPSDDISKINDIFNNGITFWKNASEVGNYSLDNR